MSSLNEFSQPIGRPVTWVPAQRPQARAFTGRAVTLKPLTPGHTDALFSALGAYAEVWTYLSAPPPASRSDMARIVDSLFGEDRIAFAVQDPSGRVHGTLSYLRIQPTVGSIEVGWVAFAPSLQRTPATTEAHYLLMRHAFEDLGYRRYEWKCDSLNAPSRVAAARLGFVEEGTWRNALTYKGRNRDTTWFSITDDEWPSVKAGLEAWLAEENFDEDGAQRRSLAELRASLGRISGT